jgi:hypothetical protein
MKTGNYIEKMKKTNIRKNKNIIEKRFKDGIIVSNGEKIFLFKGISQILWDFLESIHEDEMIKVISQTLNVPEEIVRKDIEVFFNNLRKENLIS